MTAEHPEQPGRVPVGELRELIDRWEAMAELQSNGIVHQECADELEAVIERYDQ